jgi:long-subunit fatty acid transport protein
VISTLSVRPARLLSLCALSLATGFVDTAKADGGYYSGVKGARPAGRAGAFTARADDISAVGINPAGLANIGTTLIQLGNRFSYNEHTFTRNSTLDWRDTESPPYVSFAQVKNKAPWQVLDPLIGISTNFGLKDWGFAFAAYSPAGVARESYSQEGGQRYMMVRRNAQLIDYSLSAAWKFKDLFGLGLSLQWIAVPTLDYSLIVNASPFSGENATPVAGGYDAYASVHGHDYFTLNAIVGGWFRAAPFLMFGLSGQVLPSSIETESTIDVVAKSKDVGQIQLTRNGQPANDVSLSLPLPMTFRAGARYIHHQGKRELFDIELDGVLETWQRVKTFHLDARDLSATASGETVAFADIDVQKQWQNTLGIHLGGDFNVLPDRLTARGGVYYESPVAKPAYANIDFSDGHQLGFALGGSVHAGKVEIAFAYEYRVQPTIRVSDANARVYQSSPGTKCVEPYTDTDQCNANYLGRPSAPANGGEYFAYSHIMSLDGLYRF